MSSAKGAKKSSGLSKDQAFVGTSEKKNFQNEHRSPVRLMDSTNGVEKLEIGVNECNKLEKENDGRKVDNVFSTTLLPREGEKKKRKIDGANEVAGVIEKRSEQTVEGCNFQEWTKDQEVALRRAYFAAKPSPHFWKKVSKLVPGKSAQECFDKIHSERETPTPQPHSRTRKMNFSPLNRFKLSGSKLLHSNGKKTKSYQQKALAHKTARHLLEKHHLANQGYGADLFSVHETATDLPSQAPQSKMPITPDCILKPRCYEKSSSSISKTLSKTMTLRRMDLPSPPVLKQVKNMALHEKYIDQLHSREARRNRTASIRATKASTTRDNLKEENDIHKADVKAARAALVSNAKDVIMQFQHIQSVDMTDGKTLMMISDNDECEKQPKANSVSDSAPSS